MYLRTTRQRRKHGPDAIYYQLAENYYDKGRRRSETRVIYATHGLWEELGIGPMLRDKMQQHGCEAPHDTALLIMTANRLAGPASKLACYEHWLADNVYWPAAKGLALEHLYRAMDFLLRHI